MGIKHLKPIIDNQPIVLTSYSFLKPVSKLNTSQKQQLKSKLTQVQKQQRQFGYLKGKGLKKAVYWLK